MAKENAPLSRKEEEEKKAAEAQQQSGYTPGKLNATYNRMMNKLSPLKGGSMFKKKANVSQPGDASEIQADAVAKAVTEGNANAAQVELQNDVVSGEITAKASDVSVDTPPGFEEQVEKMKGGGLPLPDDKKAGLEEMMDTDLDHVRLHTGSDAAELASDINALAFATGDDIFYPGDLNDEELLAHEVAHTLQGGGDIYGKQNNIYRWGDEDEDRVYFEVHFPDAINADLTTQLAINLYIYNFIFGLSKADLEAAGVNPDHGWKNGGLSQPEDVIGKSYRIGISQTTIDKIFAYRPESAVNAEKKVSGKWSDDMLSGLTTDELKLLNAETDRLFAAETGNTGKLTTGDSDALNRMKWNQIRNELLVKRQRLLSLPQHIKDIVFNGKKLLDPKDYDKAYSYASKLSELDEFELGEYMLKGRSSDDFDAAINGLNEFMKTDLKKTFEPTVSYDDDDLMMRLDGLEEEYVLWKRLGPLKAAYDNAQGHLMKKAVTDDDLLNLNVARIEYYTVLNDLSARLTAAGYETIDQFERDVKNFEKFFQLHTRDVALVMLANSQNFTIKEIGRYVRLSQPTGELKTLREKMAPFVAKWNTATEEVRRRQAVLIQEDHNGGMMDSRDDEAMQPWKDVLNEANVYKSDYPILGYYLDVSETTENWDAFRGALGSDQQLADLFLSTHDTLLTNVNKAYSRLDVDEPDIWKMDQAIAMTKVKLSIFPDSIFDAIIADKLQKEADAEARWEIFKAVLQVGLGILAATGIGASVALPLLAGLASLSISMYSAYEHYQDYTLQAAASGSALDKAMALTSEEPSLGWLAFDLLSIVLDFAAVIKAFKALALTAKVIGVADDGADTLKAIKAYKEAVEQEAKRLFPENIKEQENFIRRMTDKLNSEAYINKIKKQANQRKGLMDASASRVDDLRNANPGRSDISISGQLRLEKAENKALFDSLNSLFATGSEQMNRIYFLCGESDELVEVLKNMQAGISAKHFNRIMKHNLTLKSTEGLGTFRLLGNSNLSVADQNLMWKEIANYAPSQADRGLRKALRYRIVESISTDADKGLGKLFAITDDLDESSSGNLFSEWAKKNVDGGVGLGEKDIKFNGKSVRPDNIIDRGNYVEFSEFKHYRVPKVLDARELEQLKRYYDMLLNSFQYNGKPFTKIKYVVSNIETAQLNKATIKIIGQGKIELYYLDAAGNILPI